jgi:hypothetical protein
MSQHSSDNAPNYAIARIDLPDQRTHGWQVRLQRRGIKYGKFFSDSSYEDPRIALANALDFRDQLIRELEAQAKNQARICTRSTRNSSGVVGVSKISITAANGATYHFWQATWSPQPGKRCCVKFSIKRYGESEAFELAVHARTEATN